VSVIDVVGGSGRAASVSSTTTICRNCISHAARSELSAGPIACLTTGETILAFTYLPTVAVYDSAGAMRWSVDLPEFEPLEFREVQRVGRPVGFVTSYSKPGDMVTSVHGVPGGGLLVQVAHLGGATKKRPRSQRIEGRRTYLLSTKTGRIALLSKSLPQILTVTADMVWAVAEASEGYPVIVGYRY